MVMRSSLERHNEIIDQAIANHGGRLFKRIGDATCSTFPSPVEAALASTQATLHLMAEDWPVETPIRVRMGIHAGISVPDGSDFLGTGVNTVARILNLSHPGQILLSEETAKALAPNETKWLGMRMLKGIALPSGICQLVVTGAPDNFPSLPGENIGQSNLPLALNQFIGRTNVIEDLRKLISNKRLITVIGPGGAGKTRAATEVAQKVRGNFRHGVWMVNLAPIESPDLIREEIGRVMNHPKSEISDDSLIELLEPRNMLLVVDNCEHVSTEAARLCSIILSHCPEVVILATSRSPLHIPGEARYPLDSLSLPIDDCLDSLQSSDAVKLFVDRAQEVLPSFEVTAGNAKAISSLCHRMDGIPLSLELAAAQLATYSIEDIDRLITERALKLRTEDPTVLPHRQTTDSTIDWSYRLLSTEEQWLCRRIAVFAGGATREAIERIAGANVASTLQRLVYSSLVKFDPGYQRYSMLELVKEFMIDRLVELDELAEARDRHLDWVVNLAQEARPHLDGSDQAEWLDRLDLEHMNVRASLTWSTNREQRLRAAIALHWFWVRRGHLREGQAWLAGTLTGYRLSDSKLLSEAESALGVLDWELGDYANAKTHFETSIRLARQSGDLRSGARALSNLAMVRAQTGDLDGAESDFLSALEGFRKLDDLTKQAHVLNNIGVVFTMKGQPELAADQVMKGIELYEQLGDKLNVGWGLANVASSLRLCGDHVRASERAREAAKIFLKLKDFGAVGRSLLQLSIIEQFYEHWEIAAQLQGKTTALLNAAGLQVSPDSDKDWREACLVTKSKLGVKSYELHFDVGIQQPIEVFLQLDM